MNKLIIVLVIACACVYADVNVTAKNCVVTVVESNNIRYAYDLSKLGDAMVDYDDKSYTINMCDGISSGCPSSAAICMVDNSNSASSLGKLSTRDSVTLGGDPGQGIILSFKDGDDCPYGKYSSTILLMCDPQQYYPLVTVLPDDCDFSFQIISRYGCGTVHTSSGGSKSEEHSESKGGETAAIVILVILLVSVVAYFALGAVWQKKRYDASTFREYVIHSDFWFSLPGLVIDGCKFIGHGFKKGDYVSV